MTKRAWATQGLLGVLVWAWIGGGMAQAGVISPVSSSTLGVTLSIFQNIGGLFVDVTDSYLPEWAPGAPLQTVYVVVNGSTTVPTLVDTNPSITSTNPNPFLSPPTTSHYPGNCTNFGTDTGPDFTFMTTAAATVNTPAGLGYPLISNDCGGMAVIQVGNDTFIIPRTTSQPLNGIPDSWAATFCPGNACPTGKEDSDASAGNLTNGDGVAALDEYRGFIVSGRHIRTDPRQKDLFVHLVNPQCGTAAASLLGGGTTTIITGGPLFGNLNTLISGAQIHVLGYTPGAANGATQEWVDNFDHYSVTGGLVWLDPVTHLPTTTAPAGDRQINQNAVYKISTQKGVRLIECLDTSAPSLLGFASLGSPNGPDNSIIFTQRIVNYLTSTLGATCTTAAPCSYSTFQNGAWTTPVTISQTDLIARATEFYLAMEIGHTVQLTPTVEGTTKTSYGYHHAPGTGSNLDQAITNKLSSRTGNTFYIPLLYNTSDQQNFQLK